MAVQNGPGNIWRFVLGWIEQRLVGTWMEDHMRSWRQARDDMRSLVWDRENMRWRRALVEGEKA